MTWHPVPPCLFSGHKEPVGAQGLRGVLLPRAVCSAKALMAFGLQGHLEEPPRRPEESPWVPWCSRVSVPGCGTEVAIPLPWDAQGGTGSSGAAQGITGGSADPAGIQVPPAMGWVMGERARQGRTSLCVEHHLPKGLGKEPDVGLGTGLPLGWCPEPCRAQAAAGGPAGAGKLCPDARAPWHKGLSCCDQPLTPR